MLDIGNHIVARWALGRPRDYRAILELLGQHGIIPSDFAEQAQGMAGYRNRLVHGYAEVTPPEMYQILSSRIGDLTLFCKYVLRALGAPRAPIRFGLSPRTGACNI